MGLFEYNSVMMIPQAIFSRASLQPLLDIWAQIEADVLKAFPQSRSDDVNGEFSVLTNALKAMAQENSDLLSTFQKMKAKRLAHEDVCAKRVQATYNDYLDVHNTQYRSKAVALGQLWTVSPANVIAYPGTLAGDADPIDYALRLACFHRQYWASAVGFLYYLREIMNVREPTTMLAITAKKIEDRYLFPLNQRATEKWMKLLVIGGSVYDLQLAREELAGPYTSGNYDASAFLNSHLGSDNHHPMAPQMQSALMRAVTHPRSTPDNLENTKNLSDLGLGA